MGEVPSATIAATPKTCTTPATFRSTQKVPCSRHRLVQYYWSLASNGSTPPGRYVQTSCRHFHISFVPQEYLWCETCVKRISVSEVSRYNRCSICSGVLGVFQAVLLCAAWYRFHSDIVFATLTIEKVLDTPIQEEKPRRARPEQGGNLYDHKVIGNCIAALVCALKKDMPGRQSFPSASFSHSVLYPSNVYQKPG